MLYKSQKKAWYLLQLQIIELYNIEKIIEDSGIGDVI